MPNASPRRPPPPPRAPRAAQAPAVQQAAGFVAALLLTMASPAQAGKPAAAPADEHSNQPLGTLFFSPAERTAQTLARGGKSEREGTPLAVLTVSGLVYRPRNKGTVWLNEQPYPEGQPIPPAGAPQIAANGIALAGRLVRVGETLDLTGGARSDLLPDGALRIRR